MNWNLIIFVHPNIGFINCSGITFLIPQTPHRHHINAVIPLIRKIVHFCKNNHKQLKTNELQKYKFSHLGTWHDFIWELGRFLFGNLAKCHSSSWRIFVRRVGEIFKTQKNNAPFHQIVVLLSAHIRWTASCLAVTQSDKEVSKSRVPKSLSQKTKNHD